MRTIPLRKTKQHPDARAHKCAFSLSGLDETFNMESGQYLCCTRLLAQSSLFGSKVAPQRPSRLVTVGTAVGHAAPASLPLPRCWCCERLPDASPDHFSSRSLHTPSCWKEIQSAFTRRTRSKNNTQFWPAHTASFVRQLPYTSRTQTFGLKQTTETFSKTRNQDDDEGRGRST